MEKYINKSKDFSMDLYIDSESNIRSVNKPVEGLTKITLPEHLYWMGEMSEEVLLNYKFSYEDNTVCLTPTLPYNDLLLIDYMSENKRLKNEIAKLNLVINEMSQLNVKTMEEK